MALCQMWNLLLQRLGFSKLRSSSSWGLYNSHILTLDLYSFWEASKCHKKIIFYLKYFVIFCFLHTFYFFPSIEAQLAQDQAGAVKPDVQTPFKDKKDACIRLVRYHCMDQPVLSQKDLDKADEIFEHTAKHFIAKYDKMQDKYKYLLLKESQVSQISKMIFSEIFHCTLSWNLLNCRDKFVHRNLWCWTGFS